MNNRFREKLRTSSLRGFARGTSIIPGTPEVDEVIATAEARRSQLIRPHFEEVISRLEAVEFPNKEWLERTVDLLHPWRKGPFTVDGFEIDAEWRSNLKWNRIEGEISKLSLAEKVVADVGCGNGYYMFRLLELAKQRKEMPTGIFGFDPSELFYLQFEFLSNYLGDPRCVYELLGLEELAPFSGSFDLLLFMGVLYHQRDPVAALELVRALLKPAGTAIIESIVIPGSGEEYLRPNEGESGRYAKMRNVFWLPTVPLLERTLVEIGFSSVELISCEVTETSEQRKTRHMRFESLTDFLNPDDQGQTIEGYPRPQRAVFCVIK